MRVGLDRRPSAEHWAGSGCAGGRRRARLQQDVAGEQLRQDAAQRPHIDARPVGQAQDDLRRAVAPRLHVAAQLVGREAGGAEVDDLDLAPARARAAARASL